MQRNAKNKIQMQLNYLCNHLLNGLSSNRGGCRDISLTFRHRERARRERRLFKFFILLNFFLRHWFLKKKKKRKRFPSKNFSLTKDVGGIDSYNFTYYIRQTTRIDLLLLLFLFLGTQKLALSVRKYKEN